MASWRLQLPISDVKIARSCECWPHRRSFLGCAVFAEGAKSPFIKSIGLQRPASYIQIGRSCECPSHSRSILTRAAFAEGEENTIIKGRLHASDQEASKLAGILANEEQHSATGSKKLAAEREEAKAVLLQFLKNLGLSTSLSSRVARKGGKFVSHLLSILHAKYHRCYLIGREPTTAEIQGTLVTYLEALAAEHDDDLVDFLVYFPDPPPARTDNFIRRLPLSLANKPFPTRDGTGTSGLILNGNFKPSVSYALSLGLTIEQVELLAKKSPSFISCRPERNIQPVVSYFLGLGVTKAGIVKILLKWPQIFVCNLEGYLKPSMLYLESLGVKRCRWPRLLVQFPALLTYGMPKLEATVSFLHEVGFSAADIGFVISRYPQVVSFNVEQKLLPMLEFLKSIGVSNLASFLRRSPQVLGYSVEGNMKPTLRFLVELGYNQMEVISIITRFPQILGLGINSNIKPKWDYYVETGWPKSHLVAFPQYFGYSLEKRIKPRFHEVLRRGLHWTPNKILSLSDSDFERSLMIHAEELEDNQSRDLSIERGET